MTIEQAVQDLLLREGENLDHNYLTPSDKGGRTSWGISERAYPHEWKHGPPARERAAQIYTELYYTYHSQLGFGFHPSIGSPTWAEELTLQFWDFAITSGPARAAYYLQLTLGVTADSIIGPKTKDAVVRFAEVQGGLRLLNNALVASRLLFIDQLTDHEKSQKTFEEGWESRALSFLLL